MLLQQKKGHKAVAAVLVAYGADASDQNNESKPQLLKSSKQDGAKALDAFRGETESDSKVEFNSAGSSNMVKRDLAGGSIPSAVSMSRVGSNSSPQLQSAAVSKQEVPKAVTAPSLPPKPYIASVKRAVESKPVRVLENGSETALHKAIKKALDYREQKGIVDPWKKVDLIKLGKLIVSKKKYTLDDLNPEGLSALMLACGGYRPSYYKICPLGEARYYWDYKWTFMNANLDLIKLLLEAGVDPQVTNKTGVTPLMILIANVNAHGLIYWKLRKAKDIVIGKFKKEIKKLDSDGAEVLKRLILKSSSCDIEVLLIEVEDIGNENIYRMVPGVTQKFVEDPGYMVFSSPLFVKHGLIMKNKSLLYQLIRDMIIKGADVNHADTQGISTLMWACSATGGDIEIVKILIAQGADVNGVDNEGETALHWASRFGHTDAARYLVEAGANVNAVNRNMENALMLAACRGHEELVRFLAQQVHNLNQKSNTEETVLSLVCRLKPENKPLIKFLVEAGADIKQILPSVYISLSSDMKFMLEQLASKTDAKNAPSDIQIPLLVLGKGLQFSMRGLKLKLVGRKKKSIVNKQRLIEGLN